ncbi:conserved repeat domain-containing protein [Thermomonospora echinospora]|uniref:Conserved repeat domain-containing protein n=1 Tax=Thermomonospora echinospora TaxID=1992 RepID=A0A1H6CRI9_9ACTN|nr:DUF11 domain-containing protein [Thermomonospora echinospora]SEG75275.1 conserved repeat domain-containing protein [Thermomonospora echinospora]
MSGSTDTVPQQSPIVQQPVVATPARQYPSAQDVPLRVALVNGGFEEPAITAREDWQYFGEDQVPGWRTTAVGRQIELRRSGAEGVETESGAQYGELNAEEAATLYQDLPTTPGTKLYWRLSHRGRRGMDTMALDIGAPDNPVQQRTMTDGKDRWGHYSGEYVVPPGQTITRFAFRAVSAAGGHQHEGNLLDNVVFGTAPCVVVTKTAEPVSGARVGEIVTYRVNLRNEGGAPAGNVMLIDGIPDGTSYVPGSLRIIDGPGGGGLGGYDPHARQLTLPVGEGATANRGGSLPSTIDVPNGVTAEFRVRVEREGAGRTIANQATVTYDNTLGKQVEHLHSTSDAAAFTTAQPVTLALVKAADRSNAGLGEVVTFHLSVTNQGPTPATGVTVTDRLPAGSLAFLGATASLGRYEAAGGQWTIGDLPVGGTASLQLQAKVTALGPIRNTAMATANETSTEATGTVEVTLCGQPAATACPVPMSLPMPGPVPGPMPQPVPMPGPGPYGSGGWPWPGYSLYPGAYGQEMQHGGQQPGGPQPGGQQAGGQPHGGQQHGYWAWYGPAPEQHGHPGPGHEAPQEAAAGPPYYPQYQWYWVANGGSGHHSGPGSTPTGQGQAPGQASGQGQGQGQGQAAGQGQAPGMWSMPAHGPWGWYQPGPAPYGSGPGGAMNCSCSCS